MNTISINGITISGSGNIVVSNGRVTVNGKDVTPDAKEINISVNGNVDRIEVDACNRVTITGGAGNVKTMSGDVYVQGSVYGDVKTMSGDVDCAIISGSVSTISGDIRNKKS